MQLEIIESSKNRYKIISSSSNKHPALKEIAKLLKENNKHSDIKIGIYAIPNTPFSLFKYVYSYISNRADRMNKKNFYKFINGKKQMKPIKPIPEKDMWTPIDMSNNKTKVMDQDLEELFDV